MDCTVWKCHDFFITQILLEISFEGSRPAKNAVFTILGALNFVDLMNFSLQKVLKCLKVKIQSLAKSVKMADFALLESPKLISRKIWVNENSWNFHTVEPSFSTKGQKGLLLKKGKGLNKRQTFQMEANELKIKNIIKPAWNCCKIYSNEVYSKNYVKLRHVFVKEVLKSHRYCVCTLSYSMVGIVG